mmetsp:Transcript_29998/g.91837  ORF Transcript_29998/g.91837 Transcript_29998/m.91837 type:complete len:356 (-) Transcript_29998:89-1156(-)
MGRSLFVRRALAPATDQFRRHRNREVAPPRREKTVSASLLGTAGPGHESREDDGVSRRRRRRGSDAVRPGSPNGHVRGNGRAERRGRRAQIRHGAPRARLRPGTPRGRRPRESQVRSPGVEDHVVFKRKRRRRGEGDAVQPGEVGFLFRRRPKAGSPGAPSEHRAAFGLFAHRLGRTSASRLRCHQVQDAAPPAALRGRLRQGLRPALESQRRSRRLHAQNRPPRHGAALQQKVLPRARPRRQARRRPAPGRSGHPVSPRTGRPDDDDDDEGQSARARLQEPRRPGQRRAAAACHTQDQTSLRRHHAPRRSRRRHGRRRGRFFFFFFFLAARVVPPPTKIRRPYRYSLCDAACGR